MDKNNLAQYLRSIDLFEKVEESQLNRILEDAHLVKFGQDEILFIQEDPADVFYVLVEGRIKLSQLTTEGDQVTLHYLSPGEAFGIIAVLREISFPVTAQAVEDCACLAWDEKKMKNWIITYPQVALNSIRILSKFILNFQDRIRELSTERVERRIARSLLRLAMHGGKQTKDGIVLGFKLTRQDIAEMSGTTLYTVSRTLSKWEDLGLVDCRYASIMIREPHELTNIAEDIEEKG
ncbi:MAG: Crp/Fnr family transcriptional regulator [Anaerolineales bacterium]|jgi:CRP-like cAMP-binding protein